MAQAASYLGKQVRFIHPTEDLHHRIFTVSRLLSGNQMEADPLYEIIDEDWIGRARESELDPVP